MQATLGREWQKSSRCNTTANCVEVRLSAHGVQVRDSRNPEGPTLEFDRPTWISFIDYLARHDV